MQLLWADRWILWLQRAEAVGYEGGQCLGSKPKNSYKMDELQGELVILAKSTFLCRT